MIPPIALFYLSDFSEEDDVWTFATVEILAFAADQRVWCRHALGITFNDLITVRNPLLAFRTPEGLVTIEFS